MSGQDTTPATPTQSDHDLAAKLVPDINNPMQDVAADRARVAQQLADHRARRIQPEHKSP